MGKDDLGTVLQATLTSEQPREELQLVFVWESNDE